MSAPSRRNMDRAVDERQDVIEASLPKCTTSGKLEADLAAAVTKCQQPAQFADSIRRGVEDYYRLVSQLVAMYAAEIEGRKDVTA